MPWFLFVFLHDTTCLTETKTAMMLLRIQKKQKGTEKMNKKIGKYVFLTILYSTLIYGVFFPASEVFSADFTVISGTVVVQSSAAYSGVDFKLRFPLPSDGVVSPSKWRNASKFSDAEYFNPLYRWQSKVY